jgi:hypothetical protein
MDDTEHRQCLECGYILDHLPEARCPECGSEFDPEDPRTFRVRLRGPNPAPWILAVVFGTIVPAVGAAVLDLPPLPSSAPAILVSVVVSVHSAFTLCRGVPPERRVGWIVALVLSLMHFVGCGGCLTVFQLL